MLESTLRWMLVVAKWRRGRQIQVMVVSPAKVVKGIVFLPAKNIHARFGACTTKFKIVLIASSSMMT